MKSSEFLPPGQTPAEIGAGGAPSLVGLGEAKGEPRDLGPDDVEQMFGPATAPLERLRAAGMVDESNLAERGGGGVDPVENYFGSGNIGLIQKFIAEQQGKNFPDTKNISLPDGTQIPFGEFRKIATAVQAGAGSGRSVEDLVRETRKSVATALRPPEAQPTPRPADWRDGLQKDQKERLKGFETTVSGLDVAQLQGLLDRIKQLQALVPIDGWQGKGIREEDVAVCLRAIMERIEEISGQREVVGDIRNITRVARITGWRPPPDEFDPKIDLSTGGTNGI